MSDVPHPLDGLAPKNASCTACGYHFGGIAIRNGVIVCPECAHENMFERHRPVRTKRTGCLVVSLVLAAALIGVIAIKSDWKTAVWLGAPMLLFILLLRVVRSLMKLNRD